MAWLVQIETERSKRRAAANTTSPVQPPAAPVEVPHVGQPRDGNGLVALAATAVATAANTTHPVQPAPVEAVPHDDVSRHGATSDEKTFWEAVRQRVNETTTVQMEDETYKSLKVQLRQQLLGPLPEGATRKGVILRFYDDHKNVLSRKHTTANMFYECMKSACRPDRNEKEKLTIIPARNLQGAGQPAPAHAPGRAREHDDAVSLSNIIKVVVGKDSYNTAQKRELVEDLTKIVGPERWANAGKVAGQSRTLEMLHADLNRQQATADEKQMWILVRQRLLQYALAR